MFILFQYQDFVLTTFSDNETDNWNLRCRQGKDILEKLLYYLWIKIVTKKLCSFHVKDKLIS